MNDTELSAIAIMIDMRHAHACVVCNATFYSETDLQMHSKDHCEFPCHNCHRVFKTLNELVHHRRFIHETGMFLCTKCKVTFKHAAHLKQHVHFKHT